MPKSRSILLALVFCLPFSAQAQTAEGAERESRATDRMFLGFAQEATLVDRQWWEGQLEYLDGGGSVDATVVSLVAAFQPWDDVEFGGKVGFGDSSGFAASGSGATDLDLWAKFHFGQGGKNEFAAGGLLVVPTGDDAAGLGNDAFSLGGFGSFRHHGKRAIWNGNVAIRSNGDGRTSGVNIDGETSFELGAGVLVPGNGRLSFVAEVRFETERLTGADSDLRLLGGINLAAGKNKAFRAALALGATDGAPDLQVIVGYASTF